MISPGPGLLGFHALERLGHVELRHLRALDGAVRATPGDLLTAPDRPVGDTAEREATDVRRRVEVRHEGLEGMVHLVPRRWNVLDDQVEKRAEVWRERLWIRVERGAARPGVAVDDRELDLALVGIEVEKELVDLVHDGLDACVRSVDLVDDQDDGELRLERLAEHEARLRKRALARVDEEKHAVDHRQPALDLSAEVGVAGRVDDVDLRSAVAKGRVLREDRDALLALEIHRVEDALCHILVCAECARLPEQRVDERRLPVVDVGDDRDVAELLAGSGHEPSVSASDRSDPCVRAGALLLWPLNTERVRFAPSAFLTRS